MIQLNTANIDNSRLPAEFSGWLYIVEALTQISSAAITCWFNPRTGYTEIMNHDVVVLEVSSKNELHAFYAGQVVAMQNNGELTTPWASLSLSLRSH